jgi:hypothetical protein
MITTQGLEKLGFVYEVDFLLQDDGDGIVYISEWKSASPQPTEAAVEAAHIEWQAEYDAQEYARNRATAYASVGDQLDMQYWDSVNDTTTWKDHVASVKAQFPKV